MGRSGRSRRSSLLPSALIRQPPGHPLIDVASAKQIEMPRFTGHPLPVGGKFERPRVVLVATEGAIDGHETIADQPILNASGRGGGSSGDGVARDSVRQRNGAAGIGRAAEAVATLPIFVHQVSVAQVGDAGAADLAEPREGSRIRRLAQNDVDPIADALERRAVMRRAEKDELAQFLPPLAARLLAIGAGASRDEAAHTMADADEI